MLGEVAGQREAGAVLVRGAVADRVVADRDDGGAQLRGAADAKPAVGLVRALASFGRVELAEERQPARAAPPAGTRTGTSRAARTGTRAASRRTTRTDAELAAALRDLPREPDGTVPIRRATAAMRCGPDRARRLLAANGLLRGTSPDTTSTESAPAGPPVDHTGPEPVAA